MSMCPFHLKGLTNVISLELKPVLAIHTMPFRSFIISVMHSVMNVRFKHFPSSARPLRCYLNGVICLSRMKGFR